MSRRDDGRTTDYSDGYRDAITASIECLERMAAFMRRHQAPAEAALYDAAVDALRKMKPTDTPPPAGWDQGSNVR